VDAGIAEWPALYRQYLKFMADRDYTAAHQVILDRIDPLIETMDKAAKLVAVQQQGLLAASSLEARARASGSRVVAYVLFALCLPGGGRRVLDCARRQSGFVEFASEMAAVSG
jgi:hypothetical protein